jgi:phosphoglycolate phosphatase-like HAD superfamily hydrolase
MDKKIVAMYDFDGNILDAMKLHGRLAAQCMHKHFGMELNEAEAKYRSTTGIPFFEQLREIFPEASEQQIRACVDEYVMRKQSEVYGEAGLFPDVAEALKTLSKMGVMQVVSTSTEQVLTSSVLKRHNILGHFSHVMGMEQGSKPDHIDEIKKLYSPDVIIFSGDSRADVELSSIDKVVSVGRFGQPADAMLSKETLTGAGANFVVDDLRKLKGIITELDSK